MENENESEQFFNGGLKSLPIRKKLANYLRGLQWHLRDSPQLIRDLRELTLSFQTHTLQLQHPNPLNRFGARCFSQADEDGITLEILRRIDCLKDGKFAEFGVGDGTENNTLILKALGWKGFWVGGEELRFQTSGFKKFAYLRDWITLENIALLAESAKTALHIEELDVISLDLDGNDFYFVEELLAKGFVPKLFIVEYNGKFPPPVNWKIKYDPTHAWSCDDYFGASLATFVSLFDSYGFRLICCNAQTGTNAFFIRKDFVGFFEDIPIDIRDIYVAQRYCIQRAHSHPRSIKTIVRLFESAE